MKKNGKINFDKETMFFIINIILSLLIMIYSTIIVSNQDKKFQLELARFQQELEIESSYTNLLINVNYGTSFMYTCFPFISIRNNGRINANDVRIYLEVKYIDENWKPYVNDISQFHVVSYNDLPFEVNTSRKEYFSGSGDMKQNVLIVNIDYISPEGSKIFYITPVLTTPKIVLEKSVNLEIFLDTDYEKFGKYLHDYFGIANIAISATCENCTESINQPVIVNVSNLYGCHFQVLEREILDNGAEKIYGQLIYDYLAPNKQFSLFKELPSKIELKDDINN